MKMSSSKFLSCDGHFDFIMDMLVKQRSNKRYCDVTLVAEGQKYPAHRAILAASSNYFDTMFSSQMKEEFERVIKIKEVTKVAMEQVITFIYTNKVLLSEENIDEVLHAASLMQVQDLLALVIQFLSNEICPLNCLHYRQLGKLYSLNDLVLECDRCICENFDQVSTQQKFFEMDEVEMEKLISSDELVIESEEVVYECMVGWVKHHLQTRKQYFPTLFKHLRLQYVRLDYLSRNIKKEGLVREFLDCRDLVEDAFYFHVKPDLFEKQKPRKSCYPCKELIFIPNKQQNIASYNMTEKKWSSLQVVGESEQHVMFIGHDEMVYCFGYIYENGAYKTNISKRFNGIKWENLAPMVNRHSEAAVASIEGEIFVFGGLSDVQGNVVYFANTIIKYNPINNTWVKVGRPNSFQTKASAVGVGDVAYLCGGYEQVHGGQKNTTTVCAKVEVYDSVSKTSTVRNNMLEGRASCAVVHFDGKIFVFGGYGSNHTLLTSGEFMNIADGVWTMLTNNIPFQLGEVSACCVDDHIAMCGSSKPGHIALYNTNNGEWKTFVEEGQNLFNGRGCLMAK
uniref:kelch-like protein 12 isoform X5 n=1 Tax=Ciona intestinalis TaxID=7719 RepID=UPI000EF557D8|nr:kelch-like protein 12 isoform X5 [Ciona intestinalis]|eukprot:XP_018671641.2 kelch-like protein 12 isoform X5 [Ciona intestinalis]